MSRWLYNARAVRNAFHQALPPAPGAPAPASQVDWWVPGTRIPPELQIGRFVGQGRVLAYCGLASAVIRSTDITSFQGWRQNKPNEMARSVRKKLEHRPVGWYTTAVVCLLIVWTDVMLAFMFDFITPTVGPGCWSLSFLIYGALSSISWILQLLPAEYRERRFPTATKFVSYACNALAVLWMVFIIVATVIAPLCRPSRNYELMKFCLGHRTLQQLLLQFVHAWYPGGLRGLHGL